MAKKKTITSNNSGTILTSSSGPFTTINTNVSHSIWNTSTSHTIYNPNIGNQFVYQGVKPTPFNISFSWDDKSVTVTLKDGNDIFKLAKAFMEWLDKNEIEYNVKTKNKKRKK